MFAYFKNRILLTFPLSFGKAIVCLIVSTSIVAGAYAQNSPLSGKVICIDPGHGGTSATDSYRQGAAGEREEWVNLRVSMYLRDLLQQEGATVVMTRTTDEFVPLTVRSEVARAHDADVFLSIHHNATADTSVNFPIIYFHGNASENLAGVALGKALAHQFETVMYERDVPVSVVSDHTIFASVGASVLRGTYGIPAVLAEASFFTNPKEEQRLKDTVYNKQEAEAYRAALVAYFRQPIPPIHKQYMIAQKLSPFQGLQEAERMSPEAKAWYEDYQRGLALMKSDRAADWKQAYDYFTRSARSFPDSYVAGDCHKQRAILLRRLGNLKEAEEESARASEFYLSF